MNISDYESLFELDGSPGRVFGEQLVFADRSIPIVNGIPRFTPNHSYSSGNFSLLRERHAILQLDSRNGTTDRRDTLLLRTGWPPEFFRGKLILECGCGAGPDTEILRSLGADVVSVDLAGLDICYENVRDSGRGQLVQASICDLPFKKRSFDVVFCHRVLQHTPDPEQTLDHILQFVKPRGHAFVHSYAHTWRQMLRWKYAMRPITKRMNPETLYKSISAAAPALFNITEFLHKLPRGRQLAYHLVPFLNYGGLPKLAGMGRESILEYAIHDTFDALSPPYDRPIRAKRMREIAAKWLTRDFEVVEQATITLLRTRAAD